MIAKLRSIFNVVDGLFDFYAISQESRFSQSAGDDKQPKTAMQALEIILPTTRKFERNARLKSIVSQNGIDRDGTSAHWEFFFDLVHRRAKLAGEWALEWDNEVDGYECSRVDVIVRPFPPADSPLRRLVRDGHLLHRQLSAMWKQELERLPDLPHQFRDTNIVLANFAQQGLDVTTTEFSLGTGQSPEGRLCWIAQTRRDTYYAAFV